MQVRQVGNNDRFIRQQRGSEDRQGRVLGPGNPDFPIQAIAAGDDQFVHTWYVLQTSGARRPGLLGVKLHGNGVDTAVSDIVVEQRINLLLTLDR